MKSRTQQLIENVLNDNSRPTDNSLRARAFRRAMSGATPRTMTPWEWEEWYAAHGEKIDLSIEKEDE
ncbi:hypothetical protein [Congregibacter litoralis]|uniref:Uncharacterized protein n=1 Tax=Congregibacter litoralis KT71 TaxID=314285 RepID=A4A9T5_9GAMM|nr:hypothetical protein [Congregibacter litoralis]EAQ97252.1 hypothetical protein KT71_07729 [Congregibacter litoralis KT71]